MLVCALFTALAVTACGEAPTPPNGVVQNYLNALGGGSFTSACGMLDAHAREAALRSVHPHVSCPGLFRRCLPDRILNLKHDQTQLLYANMDVSLGSSGTTATVTTSGTPVAGELKRVTLRHERRGWKLTSFGRAIEQCRRVPPRHSRRKRHRRKA